MPSSHTCDVWCCRPWSTGQAQGCWDDCHFCYSWTGMLGPQWCLCSFYFFLTTRSTSPSSSNPCNGVAALNRRQAWCMMVIYVNQHEVSPTSHHKCTELHMEAPQLDTSSELSELHELYELNHTCRCQTLMLTQSISMSFTNITYPHLMIVLDGLPGWKKCWGGGSRQRWVGAQGSGGGWSGAMHRQGSCTEFDPMFSWPLWTCVGAYTESIWLVWWLCDGTLQIHAHLTQIAIQQSSTPQDGQGPRPGDLCDLTARFAEIQVGVRLNVAIQIPDTIVIGQV